MKRIFLYTVLCAISLCVNAQEITTLKTVDFDKTTSPWCIIQSSDTNFIIGGSSSIDPYDNTDAFLMKVDPNGDSLWTIRYKGEYVNVIRDIIPLNDSAYVGVGIVNSQMTDMSFLYGDLLLLSFNNRGDTLWSKKYGAERDDEGYQIIKSKFGGMITCGMFDLSAPNSLGSYWILRLNDLGDTIWTRSLDMGPSSAARALAEDSIGNIYALGSGAYMIKLDKNGTILDTIKIQGDLVIHSINFKNYFFFTGIDAIGKFVCKIDLNGNLIWNKYFSGSFFDLLLSSDNAILLLTKEESSTVSVSKITTDGTTLWNKKINTVENFNSIIGTAYIDNKHFMTGYVVKNWSSKLVFMILEDKTNGVIQIKKPSLIRFVNNGHNSVNVLSNNIMHGNLIFFNSEGKKIRSISINESPTLICDMVSGLYLFSFTTEKGEVQTGKVIIK